MDKELQKLIDEIKLEQEKEAWRKLMKAKIDMIELQLKYDWRSSYRKEYLMDKYLVTLRPWANRHKNKRPKGLGWKDDA